MSHNNLYFLDENLVRQQPDGADKILKEIKGKYDTNRKYQNKILDSVTDCCQLSFITYCIVAV